MGVLFEDNKMSISVFLTQVSREVPTLPGGYAPRDRVWFIATKKQIFSNGDKLDKGIYGEIIGKSTMGDGSDDRRIKVRFDGNSGPINVFLSEIAVPPELLKEFEAKKTKRIEEDARMYEEEKRKMDKRRQDEEAKQRRLEKSPRIEKSPSRLSE